MPTNTSKPSFLSRTQRFIFTGILTLIPIWITLVIFGLILQQLSAFGQPIAEFVYSLFGARPTLMSSPMFQAVFSVFLTLVLLYLIGWATSKFVGRRLIGFFDALMHSIPFVERVYGSIKKLMSVLQQKPDGVQRVVLIEFPSEHMKTVGFVTRTLKDEDTGNIIAAVYVPTTPNPTSGYLELVPIENVISTNWTMDEAMSFIISGGAISRDTINYSKSHGTPISFDEAQNQSAAIEAAADTT
jgi:uncharacterized membrane protein